MTNATKIVLQILNKSHKGSCFGQKLWLLL